jgi:hypothetical protein
MYVYMYVYLYTYNVDTVVIYMYIYRALALPAHSSDKTPVYYIDMCFMIMHHISKISSLLYIPYGLSLCI